jgi:trimeric autotransporter adhesin
MRITQKFWSSLLRSEIVSPALLNHTHHSIQLTTTSPSVTALISRSPLWRGFLLITLACILAWFALLPTAQAVDPPPDGGYPGLNTAEGDDALFSLTIGVNNTAIGFHALYSNTTGNYNTATGAPALYSNTTGFENTADGWGALAKNTTGNYNTATGALALENNTTGNYNTATGAFAMNGNSNPTGNGNTATGCFTLFLNQTGSNNTANGISALTRNQAGHDNTASGALALNSNTNGIYNTANGVGALFHNRTGKSNTANGFNVLYNNTSGNFNVALGANAGYNLTTGGNNIDIFNRGVAGESNTIRIGKAGTQTATFIAGISGATVAGGVGVIVDTNGHLGTISSSERFKDKIRPMDKASEAILGLQPVTFRYKQELDPAGIPQFGLVAEQVEKVNPDLVARNEEGKAYTVRYEAVNAMLLNEFLKEHRKVEQQGRKGQEQEATITELKSTVTQQQKEIKNLTASLKKQAARIQKVSDELAGRKPAPQMVAND